MRKNENNAICRYAFYVLAVMLFLLPFHAFGTVLLNYGFGLAETFGSAAIISMWKEFLIVVLTILLGVKLFKDKKFPKLDSLDKLILAYMVFGLVHALIFQVPIARLIWGARYDYVFLWVFLVVRHLGFGTTQVKSLFKITLLGGVLSLLAGYLIHFVLRPENLTALGFRNDWSTWYPEGALAFCQRIENQELCRMSGTFAGPNQLGAYMVLILPLVYMWRKTLKPARTFIVAAMVFAALYFTYSRGAYIGAFVAFATLAVYEFGLLKYSRYFLYWTLSLMVLIGALFAVYGIPDVLIRPESTGEHFAAWMMGIDEMIRRPLGGGFAAAGPASYRFENPIIPESWYLQVGIEFGFIGLALFLTLLVNLAKRLHRRNPYMLASLFGVLAISFFLHTFEDSAVSITLFALIGSVLGQKAETLTLSSFFVNVESTKQKSK